MAISAAAHNNISFVCTPNLVQSSMNLCYPENEDSAARSGWISICCIMRADRALAAVSLMKHIWQRHPRCEPIVHPAARLHALLLPRCRGEAGGTYMPPSPNVLPAARFLGLLARCMASALCCCCRCCCSHCCSSSCSISLASFRLLCASTSTCLRTPNSASPRVWVEPTPCPDLKPSDSIPTRTTCPCCGSMPTRHLVPASPRKLRESRARRAASLRTGR